jgi:hypothetical protein
MVTGAGIQAVLAVFLLLLVFVAMFAGLARRLKVPYPILLVPSEAPRSGYGCRRGGYRRHARTAQGDHRVDVLDAGLG